MRRDVLNYLIKRNILFQLAELPYGTKIRGRFVFRCLISLVTNFRSRNLSVYENWIWYLLTKNITAVWPHTALIKLF